jgi:hypothetical protein
LRPSALLREQKFMPIGFSVEALSNGAFRKNNFFSDHFLTGLTKILSVVTRLIRVIRLLGCTTIRSSYQAMFVGLNG